MMTDREKTIKDFEYQIRKAHGEGWDFVDVTTEDGFNILKLLKEQETIVRCKDCKHRPIINKNSWIGMSFPDEKCPCLCDDPFYSWYPEDNWFCGNGERAIE